MRYFSTSLLMCVLVGIVASSAFGGFQVTSSYAPKNGFVPDARTAVLVAEAVLAPIYGDQQVASERPFTASLKDGIWTVMGHLRTPNGGVAIIKISKRTCRVLFVSHGE